MNKFRSRLLFTFVSLIVFILVGLGLLLETVFENYYIDHAKERMVKETGYVAVLAEEQGFEDVLKRPYVFEKLEEKIPASIIFVDEKKKVQYGKGQQSAFSQEMIKELSAETAKQRNKVITKETEQKNEFYHAVFVQDVTGKQGYILVKSTIEPLKDVHQKTWGLLIIGFVIACLVVVFLGMKITGQYIRPIESVTKVAIELAKGNYKARAYESHSDETGMLSKAINILARNLQEMTLEQEMQQDRLHTLIENMGSGMILIDSRGYINLVNRSYKETFHVTDEEYLDRLYYESFHHTEIIELVEEIFMTEVKVRKQMLLPLGIERKHFEVYGAPIIGTNHEWKGIVLVFHDITELKRLEQMRKDFLANVSHELKTPITSIKGFSETLLDGAMDNKKFCEHFLRIILKESERMQGLIEDLLDLSKIEQQGFKLNMETVDMKGLLEDIHMVLDNKAGEKEISLQVNVLKRVSVIGDPGRLKQIFINLINNAIVYTPAGGVVSVELAEDKYNAYIKVSDTGIGISKDEIPRIFERFYRVDKARSRNTGGTGLGLSIVKHLVEAHHGTITVDSEVGEGTTFTVVLPKSATEK
ncbi:sensory box histidine kinase PhoR [Bacillus toyonensis]|uniref:sensory box histidine kinase PhoR n=1 Tax=Bacillus toyonensis TaxID=155322 RepID=UPI00069B30FB|nr:sensory box histidine kinase PhoR [Bacillus toyonensis]KNH42024.1 alkaline phosphatase [Bacillus thuringiensis]OTX31331.1 PAS domain-containing sensor histidine kinase [Bacillus thuringiensis serovar malayensis]OUB11576.1 PAS domain-containing sensor histidine kinase [Bacillus thuringiensis serovar shandongiensis]MBX0353330.1 sensory box histidine kinase PhoR [Bacillus toyonensis]MDM5256495.1 sensory box histidine kinase PhoR [Bacillus toyonensis]